MDSGGAVIYIIWLIGAWFYFVPLQLAFLRNHHNIGAIAVVNVFLGWTFVGWVVALAMAAGEVRKPLARSPR